MRALLESIFLASILFDAGVVIWVLIVGREKILARMFAILFLFVIAWKISMWLGFYVPTTPQVSLFVDQLSFGFGSILVFGFSYFTWCLVQKKFASVFTIWLLGAVSAIFAVLSFIPNLIVGTRVYLAHDVNTYFITTEPLTFLFYISTLPGLLLTVYLLVKAYKDFSGLAKMRVAIVGLSIATAFFIGILTNIIVPLVIKFVLDNPFAWLNTFYSDQQVVGATMLSIVSGVTSYAITRYRFMNIRLILKKSLVYGAAILLTLFLYIYIALFFYNTLQTVLVWIFAILFLAFGYEWYRTRLKRFLDAIFFLGELDLSRKFSDQEKELNSTHEIDAFVRKLVCAVEDIAKTPVALFLVAEREHNRHISYFPVANKVSLSFADPVLADVSQDSVILREELLVHTERKTLSKYMERHHASTLLIFRHADRIIGMCFIARQQHHRPLFREEMQRLQHVVDASSGALYQAIIWHETLEGLKQKMHEETYAQT